MPESWIERPPPIPLIPVPLPIVLVTFPKVVLVMFWGLLIWREFAGADSKVTRLIVLMLFFFAAGLALLSLAPLYAR